MEKMRPTTIKVGVRVGGMVMPVFEGRITNIATVPEIGEFTDLVCPVCKNIPAKPKGHYECSCGRTYSHWSKLLRVIKGTKEPIEVKPLGSPKAEDILAEIGVMSLEEFKEFADVTLFEYGLTVADRASAENLKKLLVAIKQLGQVVIVKFRQSFYEKIALLTTSISNRVLLKEILPVNIALLNETMRVSDFNLTPEQLEEVKAFLKLLPKADERMLQTSDWRAKAIQKAKEPAKEKAHDLEEIIAVATAKV
jgi:hypothetical protein